LRKTQAGRILLGITNLVILAIMFTTVYSAIPPAYSVGISPGTVTSTPSAQIISVDYSVTNNGFYAIDNFYVDLEVRDPSGAFVNSTRTVATSIQRGSSRAGNLNVTIAQSYISTHHGNYAFTLSIHSEFAYGLIKFSVQRPFVVPF
jgi:hypothetical protein